MDFFDLNFRRMFNNFIFRKIKRKLILFWSEELVVEKSNNE